MHTSSQTEDGRTDPKKKPSEKHNFFSQKMSKRLSSDEEQNDEGKRSCGGRNECHICCGIKCANFFAESCSTCKQSICSTCLQTHVAMRHSENINPLCPFCQHSIFHYKIGEVVSAFYQGKWYDNAVILTLKPDVAVE